MKRCIGFISLLLCILLLPSCSWMYYESYTTETKELDLSLAVSGQRLEDYLAACVDVAGEYTGGMSLTYVEGTLVPNGAGYAFGSLSFTFQVYIDDSREGGYIRSAEYQISADDLMLDSVYIFDGAGKAFIRGSEPMEDSQLQYAPDTLVQLFWQEAERVENTYGGLIRFDLWRVAKGEALRWYIEREDGTGWIGVDAL